MTNLVVGHEGRTYRQMNGAQIRRWVMAALMIFLGLSGPALGYIRAVEPNAD